MKKVHVLIIFLFAVCPLLTACSLKNSQSQNENSLKNSVTAASKQKTDETDELSERLKQYKSFLQDEISSETKSDDSFYLSDFCNNVDPKETEDGISYALFDMTGDGLPELHVLTDISYSIHTIENNQLITWYEGDRYVRPLNNRAVLEIIEGNGTDYSYSVLDNKGEVVFFVGFAEPPKGSESKYLFSTGGDDIELSKKDWDKLTKPILTIDSDKIIWEKINNLNF